MAFRFPSTFIVAADAPRADSWMGWIELAAVLGWTDSELAQAGILQFPQATVFSSTTSRRAYWPRERVEAWIAHWRRLPPAGAVASFGPHSYLLIATTLAEIGWTRDVLPTAVALGFPQTRRRQTESIVDGEVATRTEVVALAHELEHWYSAVRQLQRQTRQPAA